MDASGPNRWMHLRQPEGFDPHMFEIFRASCDIFAEYCRATLRHQRLFGRDPEHPHIEYIFFEPEISEDRTIVSLPIGGNNSLSSRNELENMASFMLWQHLPGAFLEGLEEGLRDNTTGEYTTNWRLPNPRIEFIKADPELRRRYFLRGKKGEL